MQKNITKLLILTLILTAALSVNYLFAAWVGPTQAPTGGNTSTPVHVGTTDQVKNGGLSLDALAVFGNGYFQGRVGVGVVTPTEALDVDGGAKISEGLQVGNSTNANAGTIRWTGGDLEVYDGSVWLSLTSSETTTVVSKGSIECDAVQGSWEGGQDICYFSGTTCPSGWTQKNSYITTDSRLCVATNTGRIDFFNYSNQGTCGGGSCQTVGSRRQNTGIDSCSYTQKIWSRGSRSASCVDRTATCYAIQTEIGCTKN